MQSELDDLLRHFSGRNYSEAATLARRLIESSPQQQFAWKILGAALGAAGRSEEAIPALQRAL